MKFAARSLVLVCITAVLAGCHHPVQWFPPAKDPSQGPVNCVELKRQRLYNMTNMNMETNDTTLAQRQALDDLIAKNCK